MIAAVAVAGSWELIGQLAESAGSAAPAELVGPAGLVGPAVPAEPAAVAEQ